MIIKISVLTKFISVNTIFSPERHNVRKRLARKEQDKEHTAWHKSSVKGRPGQSEVPADKEGGRSKGYTLFMIHFKV